MSFGHTTQYEAQGDKIPKRVWFSGTDTALKAGSGVCYDYTYVTTDTGKTATDSYGFRSKVVTVPTSANNHRFAGVCATDYKKKSVGQWIDIWEPGSVVDVAVGADTTIDTAFLTCSASGGDAGIFSRKGLPGRGSMVPLQTQTVINNTTDGSGSITGATLTKTSAFTNAVVGDFVYISSVSVTSTGAADATGVRGKYKIVTRTSANVVVLGAAAGEDNTAATPVAPNFTAASSCDFFVASAGGETCLAYLMTGEESGLQENLQSTGGTQGCMLGGTTFIGPGGSGGTNVYELDAQTNGLLLKQVVCIAEPGAATVVEGSGVVGRDLDGGAITTSAAVADATYLLAMFEPSGTEFKVITSDMVIT